MQSNVEKSSQFERRQVTRPTRLQIDRQTVLLLGVFGVLLIFFSNRGEDFLTPRRITSMAFQLPELGVLALAMIVSIISGGINLSVNATSNLAAVLAGLFLVRLLPKGATPDQATLFVMIAMLLMLAIGVLTGIVNGLLIGYIGVPPILATLATMTFFTGISTGITGGKTVTGLPDQFSVIGNQSVAGIPIPFIIFVVCTIIAYVILFHTSFGFKTRMIGASSAAASFTGIDNKVIILKVYILSGVFAAITGILVMSRTMSAAIEYGSTTYVLLTILIAVLANIVPGFGNVFNVFVAVLILQILSTGFNMLLLGVSGSSFFKDFAWGVLMIVIFIINFFLQGRQAQQE